MSDLDPMPASGCAGVRHHLMDLVDGHLDAVPPAIHTHSQDCSSCSRLVAATKQQVRVLQNLPRPSLPAALQDPALLSEQLSAIAERAGARAEQHLGPLLKETLHPLVAPGDTTWTGERPLRLLSGRDELAIGLEVLAERRRSPSRLWLRVRKEIDVERQARSRVPRSAARTFAPYAVAAAALIFFLLVLVPDQNVGTSGRPQFVVISLPAGSLSSVSTQEGLFDLIDRMKEG